jgi:hypothetical protein
MFFGKPRSYFVLGFFILRTSVYLTFLYDLGGKIS